ncbi:putative cytosol aminopeptidase [Lysinibacillus alkalisoli]|uniref:Probable cytosol aminopeptidase n=1 Tax=Lysinibacillus alkalisoli TaxID=1911548 RepID=A0A917G637_9BACI|nr:leucyl aminopeptidase [Lysinibacillus alkalisoli]GGG24645.1 putative cytosol aminopeptidase [Lysinibacillus alkalisoli]
MQVNKNETTFDTLTSDLLIVGAPKNRQQWEAFYAYFGEEINTWFKEGDISTETKKITKIPVTGKNIKRILFVGLGDNKSLSEKTLRESFGVVGKAIKEVKAESIGIWLASFATAQIEREDVAYLAGEGLGLGYYTVENYKTTSNEPDVSLQQVSLVATADIDEVAGAFEAGVIYADATNYARRLINMPPNLLTATKLADFAQQLAEKYDFEVEILNKAQLEEMGAGGILAVNQGSVEEPRLITLRYKATADFTDVIGLVGKGVTYDTGGYSLKPGPSMVGMKGDMGGAAAVLGAMQIVGEMRPNQNVVAVIGATDNMISGQSLKPDDVITTLSGKTVEVLNTDAEGRLVLADATTYAKQQGADYLFDVATLTGGVIVALGMDKTGALTNDEAFFEDFMLSTGETDEFVWRLPLTESDKKRIRKSEFADLNNSPGRDGHMIFGGGFVGEFAEETPWIHLDIAGTSDAEAPYDLGPKGGTGAMVRTLASFIERKGAEK